MGQNYAAKYSPKVDERFYRDSQAAMATNKDYDWTGVKTINVYQIDTVPLNDYNRTGSSNRYGNPSNLGNTIQTFTVSKDRAFTYLIDKGDKLQSQMLADAGKSLAREEREVIVPEIDTYTFGKMAAGAAHAEHAAQAAVLSTTAYATFLGASEVLGNANVPDAGRIAFCSYGFANLMMQDPAFIKYSEKSQEMVIKGILGEVDGTKIVKVPASRLPIGCSFLVAHPAATVAVEQLNEFKIHEDAPGFSGWLVEGRIIYDAFVLAGKEDALYIHFGTGVLATLDVERDTAGKLHIKDDVARYSGADLKIKAGTTLPTYGADDTGYTDAEEGTAIAASSIVVLSVGGKIIAATAITVA